MPSLKALRKRIVTVRSTQKITKAMKMVAAARLRLAQESAERARPYAAKLNEMFRLSTDILRHLITTKSPYLTKIPSFAEVTEIRTDEDRDRPRQAAPVQQAPAVAAAPVTMEELDKKLDQILTDEVL